MKIRRDFFGVLCSPARYLHFVWVRVFLIVVMGMSFCGNVSAGDRDASVISTEELLSAESPRDIRLALDELKDFYFQNHDYSGFMDLLRDMGRRKKKLLPFIDYYGASARYQQLKYLEETQSWDEYFENGNIYRQEIMESGQRAVDFFEPDDPLYLYSRLLLWQFHRDQQDVFHEESLTELIDAAAEYSVFADESLPLKTVADVFLSYGEKSRAQKLYRLYVEKLAGDGDKTAELKDMAEIFYNEKNFELAQIVYDAYINDVIRQEPKGEAARELINIAGMFVCRKDCMLYAEKIFAEAEKLGSEKAFDENISYSRAFNLEKAKEYEKANEAYRNLIKQYPSSVYSDEAAFKTGMILTYVLRNMEEGTVYFNSLADKIAATSIGSEKEVPQISPWMISAIYQLGLLSQWKGDLVEAKEFYIRAIKGARDEFQDTVNLAKTRIKEIEEKKPIEHNLKTFLDLSLKEENRMYNMSKVYIESSPLCSAQHSQEVEFNSSTYMPESGCMQVKLQYLWSGHVGEAEPSYEEGLLKTSYTCKGTKEINLVVTDATGVIDRCVYMLDIK